MSSSVVAAGNHSAMTGHLGDATTRWRAFLVGNGSPRRKGRNGEIRRRSAAAGKISEELWWSTAKYRPGVPEHEVSRARGASRKSVRIAFYRGRFAPVNVDVLSEHIRW